MKKAILILISITLLGNAIRLLSSNKSYKKEYSFIISIPVTNRVILENDTFLTYIPKNKIDIYWKDSIGNKFKYFYDLNNYLVSKHKEVLFMTNAGMYTETHNPLGLLIQDGKLKQKINLNSNPVGNFYKKPNGVFYITYDNKNAVCNSTSFNYTSNIRLATQSGPMLVIDGKVTSVYNQRSSSIRRNGVGILPDGNVLFVLAIKEVTFKEFTDFFIKYKCTNALNLDGGVSDAYCPSKNKLEGTGDFGPILVVTKN